MRWMRVLWSRVAAVFQRRRIDDELRRELSGHLDEATEDYVRQGVPQADARRLALRRLGNLADTEHAYREHLSVFGWDRLRRDFRHALRGLRRSPAFSFVAVAVLAIGTAAVLAVFTLIDRVVLRPLPYPNAHELVTITHDAPGANLAGAGISSGLLFHYRAHAQSFESIGTYSTRALSLQLPDATAERVEVTLASVSFFRALRVAPAIGRLFTDEDAKPGFMNTRWAVPVLLSHRLWAARFGANPDVVGQTITLSNNGRLVVGVLPEDFAFPSIETDIWMLMEPPEQTANFAGQFGYDVVARMRPGTTIDRAQAELARVIPDIVGSYTDATPERLAQLRLTPSVKTLKSTVVGDVASMLWPLFVGMLCLLLMAFANVTSLFLVRAEDRRQEIAVRQALGADRRAVARLFFIEGLILTLAAAGTGLALATGAVAMTVAWAPVELPRAPEIRMDGVAVALSLALAVGLAFLFAFATFRHHRQPATDLLAGGRSITADRTRGWTTHALVAVQVALALSLTIGSVLMIATYRNLSRRDLGFSPERLLAVDLALSGRMAASHQRIYRDLTDRIRELPAVESAAAASFAPLTTGEHIFPIAAGAAPIPFKFVTPGYFQTMQMDVVEGTALRPDDILTVESPVLISAALARRLFPGANAIGQPIRRLNEDGTVVSMALAGPDGSRIIAEVPPFTVAGVVGNVRETSLRDEPSEIVYVPILEPRVERSITPVNVTLLVRGRMDAAALAPSIRNVVSEVSSDLTVGQVRTMDDIVRQAHGRETFVGGLLVSAAAASMFLGMVGVYGSVSQVVKRRTKEMGIRMALGARRGELVRLVATGSIRAVAVGVALGLAVALAGADLLDTLLFGVRPRDPLVLTTAAGMLVVAALAAALLAGRRAARIPVVSAMQSE